MSFLLELDRSLFRFINGSLANPALDWLMPFFAWNKLFIPAVLLLGAWLLWKGGLKGRLFVLFIVLCVTVADGVISDTLKDAVGRSRPFAALPETRLLVGAGGSGSFPSSHAANWFAAATAVWIYYRRAFWLTAGIALIVAFSRIYVGVHYPSDVLAGALIGLLSALGVVGAAQLGWRTLGRKWFPLWWARAPSLLPLRPGGEQHQELYLSGTDEDYERLRARQSERLAYALILLLLVSRWLYIGAGKIELSEDEAYQWLWSQHLDLSYYSKPPLIAYAQFLGTSLFGHTEFGVRFLSPFLAAVLSATLVRWFVRERGARAGLLLLACLSAAPILAVGATLMTIDALSVFFWGMAMVVGWRAVQNGRLTAWIAVGVLTAFGFLSKYVAVFQIISWAVFFWVSADARRSLRRAGPWVALVLSLLSFIPVLIWNARHDWITFTHLAERGGLDKAWSFKLRYFFDFVGAEFFLLNPLWLILAIGGVAWFARRMRADSLAAYLICMGGPVFVFYLLYTFRARVQPNWIAPAVLSILGIAALRLTHLWEEDPRRARRWLTAGMVVGLPLIIVLHDTNLAGKIMGRPLPPKLDPLVRVRGWSATAAILEEERQRLAGEGSQPFVIGGHYGITSLMTFYNPAAKGAQLNGQPFTYYLHSPVPLNQFYFWPSYMNRKGQNAIYIRRATSAEPPPPELTEQFRSVTDLGLREISYRGRVIRTVQLFACRNLL